jgi:hypothetical protein
MLEDAGLAGIGEYTGREGAGTSQTTQGTVQTAPVAEPAAPLPQAAPPPAPQAPAPPEPSKPAEPGPDLIADLGKAFAKTIGELPPAQPAEPAKPQEPKPAEPGWQNADPPPTTTKKVAEDWRNFREKAKADVSARDDRIKALEAELEKTKAQGPIAEARMSEIQKQAQEAMGIVERIAIERSPVFKSKVLDQEALLVARMKQLVEGTGISQADAEKLLRGDLTTREGLVQGRQMSPFRSQQIAETLGKWDQVAEERGKMLERGKETLQQYLKEQQQAQESARAQFLRESGKVFEDQMQLAVPKLEVYNHIEGNEKWNSCCDALKTVARRLYDGNVSREMVAQAAILAPAAVAYQNLLRAAYGQIEELRVQVNKLKGLQPGVRDTGGDVMQPNQALSSPNGDFVKGLVDRFKRDTGLQ